jgi:Ca2+-binding RTX toxin-like protein
LFIDGQGVGTSFDNTLIKFVGTPSLAANRIATATTSQVITGTSGDDLLLGGTAGDTISGLGGSDAVVGFGGGDQIQVTQKAGAFLDVIDGGPGTDVLTINYGSISGLGDFTRTYSGGYQKLTDSAGGAIKFQNIETIEVGAKQYTTVQFQGPGWMNGSPWSGIYAPANFGQVFHAYYDGTHRLAYLYEDGTFSSFGVGYALSSFGGDGSGTFTVYGSNGTDYIAGRTGTSNPDVIYGGAGDDIITAAGMDDSSPNADQIYGGDGNDTIIAALNPSGSGFTPVLDGGAGVDTLQIQANPDGITLTLTVGGAINFENLTGSYIGETIVGDAGDNVLSGGAGTDVISGGDGNDTLYAAFGPSEGGAILWGQYAIHSRAGLDNGGVEPIGQETKDTLDGGAGNDILYGSKGDNVLIGGTGHDELHGLGGADVFVLGAADGGSTIATADTIFDFTAGTDLIRLAGGLTFQNLVISQGTGSHLTDTIIQIGATHEYLAVLLGVQSTSLISSCFE